METSPEIVKNKRTNCARCNTLLTGIHCLAAGCGWSKSPSIDEQKRSGSLKLHRKPEPEDGQGLIDLLGRFNLTLPRNAIEWRVSGKSGTHTALGFTVKMLCTDGVVAWFLLGNGVTTMFGHLSNFEEAKEQREASASKPRGKSERQLLLESF